MQIDCNVLYVSDNGAGSVDFIKVIKTETVHVCTAESIEEAQKIFDEKRPKVILFYYSTVEISEEIYFSIYRNSKYIHNTPHRAVVICDHVDIEKANHKCIRGIFFDYVVMSPRFDWIRVNLSIRNALASIGQSAGADKSRDFVRIGEEIQRHKEEMDEVIEKSSAMISSNENSFKDLSRNLTSNIKQFSNDLVNKNQATNSKMTSADINKEADKFSLDVLEKDLQNSKEKINSVMKGYADRLAATQKKHEKSLSALNDLSKSVSKRVLIVEDNEVYGDMVKTVLNKEGGFEVTLTSTVHQGTAFMLSNMPDVVLLDYELPDATAGEFLEKARAVPSLKHTPVIILTSHNNTDVFTTTMMLGAQDFLVKPANKHLILDKINKCLDQARKLETR